VHENLIVDRTHQLLVIAAFNYRDFWITARGCCPT
jgi:hypothetical protein